MHKLIFLILISLTAWAAAQSNVPSYPQKTTVTIDQLYDQKTHFTVFVDVAGASKDSQVLIFQTYKGRDGFFLAQSISGDPPLPRTRYYLPDKDTARRNLYRSTWFMNVALITSDARPSEFFAVVVEVRSKYSNDRSLDEARLQRLPFSNTKDFADVLLLLQDFGWTPTGYTKTAR